MREQTDAIILCGGAGLRLRSVIGDAPKGMAAVAGRPFLEVLLRQMARHGFKRVILAVGYQGNVIFSRFGNSVSGMELVYSAEPRPLGTAGALRNAAELVNSDNVLVMNGDSYTDVDLTAFVRDYQESKYDVSVVVVPADGRNDCGFVVLNDQNRVVGFNEKTPSVTARYLNAGIYMLASRLLCEIPADRQMSLEREIFPQWLSAHRCIRSFVHPGTCVDIGTPERYRDAQALLADVEAVALTQGSDNRL